MTRNLLGLFLGLVVLVNSFGCGIPVAKANPREAARTPAPSPTQTPAPNPVPAPVPVAPVATIPPTSTSFPTIVPMLAKPGPAPNEVWVVNIEYRPNQRIVPMGTTVTWISKDGEGHDIVSDTGLFEFHTVQGESYNFTFTERGTFYYYCDCAVMLGAVIVE